MRSITIDAKDLHYTPLNLQIRKAIADGVKDITVNNVLGQRFIGDGIRGDDVTITLNGVPGLRDLQPRGLCMGHRHPET